MAGAFANHLAQISWALFSVALLLAICRFVSQRLLAGPSPSLARAVAKVQVDDYMMALTVVALLGIVVAANQVATHGSNYIPDDWSVDGWTDDQKQRAIWGSKMSLALEEFMLATLWLVKACLLVLYARMTARSKQWAIAVQVVAGYCGIGFLVIQGLYLFYWCRPVYNYWALPVPADQEQCKTYQHHMIVTSVFHVSSDLAMLAIPVPMLIGTRLPLRRKLVLCGIFSLGAVNVLVAALNRYYNFTEPDNYVFLVWYCAEASTAVMVANMPFCWTFLQRVFKLGSWGAPSAHAPARSRRASAAIAMDVLRRRQEAWNRVEDTDGEIE